MLALFKDESIADKVYKLLRELSEREQKKILSKVEEQYRLMKAKEVDNSVKKNKIKMDDIVSESRIARKKIARKYNGK